MKRSRDAVNARRDRLINILNKTGDIRVPEIAQHLKVSEITVRRDLQYLESKNMLDRYYGGAKVREDPAEAGKDLITRCREAIARYAASLVEDNDTLFINTSSTALLTVHYITAKNVTVITNNGNAIETQHSNSVNIVLTGGELKSIKGTMVGEFALHNITSVTAKKTFIGCSGLSIDNGMTTELLNEVDINQTMVDRTIGTSYILADHSKLGINSSFISCRIDRITDIITDNHANPELISQFRERGIRVRLVNVGV